MKNNDKSNIATSPCGCNSRPFRGSSVKYILLMILNMLFKKTVMLTTKTASKPNILSVGNSVYQAAKSGSRKPMTATLICMSVVNLSEIFATI